MPDPSSTVAEEVLKNLGLWRLPVDPLLIAREEGVHLVPSSYGTGFDARIEYYQQFDRFAIYYQEPGFGRPDGRVRFSLAHELGHFYLPHHRERLRAGYMHNSVVDFGSRDATEQEADRFAAALLMPRELFANEVRRFRGQFCTLSDLCILAERLGTSVTSTAIRYCSCDIEPALIVLSRNRKVLWTSSSEGMKRLGLYYVEYGSTIPNGSKTAILYDKIVDANAVPQEGGVESAVWFNWPKRERIWEEAMPLGDRVLTYITVHDR